jgi:hypothetical protein
MPMDNEIIICVDSHGPSYFTSENINKTDRKALIRRDVQVGGEPGGGPLGSSYDVWMEAMTTRKGRVVRDAEGARHPRRADICNVNPSEQPVCPVRAPQ